MRVAVISDIHGNCIGLNAALADIDREPVDQIVCLGDAIQGGPQPGEVGSRLRELGCPIVMGNADAWLLSGIETGNEPMTEERRRILDAVRAWSLTKLSASDRRFIEAFQPTVKISLDGGQRLLCFHGSPASFDDIILPDIPQERLFHYLGGYPADVLAGGHTHVQHMRRIGADARFFFNPGSVGLAYSHHQPDGTFHADPWAEYAVLTSEGQSLALEFRRVPYDIGPLIKAYESSGRPYAERAVAEYKPV